MLDGVTNAVGKVVHGVDTPSIAGALVGRMANAINHRVTHVQVGRRHINLQPRHMATIRKFTGAHALKQIQIFVNRSITVGAVFTGLSQCASGGAHLFRIQGADVGFPIPNQGFGKLINLLEVVRGMRNRLPLKTEPRHVALNRFDELVAFFHRVGVIEAEKRFATVFLGNTEVQTDTLGVANVQKSVRFRRESRDHTLCQCIVCQICFNALTNKIRGFVVHYCLKCEK